MTEKELYIFGGNKVGESLSSQTLGQTVEVPEQRLELCLLLWKEKKQKTWEGSMYASL